MGVFPFVTVTDATGSEKVMGEYSPEIRYSIKSVQKIRIDLSESEAVEALIESDGKFTVSVRNGGPIVRTRGLDEAAVERVFSGFFYGDKNPLRDHKWQVVDADGNERFLARRATSQGEPLVVFAGEKCEERFDSVSPENSSHALHCNGWIYILTNISMPGIVKIGRTDRDSDRESC